MKRCPIWFNEENRKGTLRIRRGLFRRRLLPSEGFTLLELLIVIGVLSLLLALSVPWLSSKPSRSELKSAARELASAVRAAGAEAINRHQETVFTLDVEAREYAVGEKGVPGRLAKNLSLKLVTAESERVDETRGRIRFFPDGSSTGGRVTVGDDERAYVVTVDWITGRVVIVE